MKILIACEVSGTVGNAFRKFGHDVTTADLQFSHNSEMHYWGDVLDILYQDWDLVIAFPPCTYLANVGAHHLYGKRSASRYQNMIKAANFFNLFLELNIPYCVENPKHFNLSKELIRRPADQVIQPYQFGDPYTKYTQLWLNKLPKLVPTNIVNPVESYMKTVRRPDHRSLTFPGIAAAMAEQWGKT